MLFNRSLTGCLALAVSLSLASACAPTVETFQTFPPAADLQSKPKPQLDPAELQAEIAAGRGEALLDQLEINIETWGTEGWNAVGRICRWAVANGAKLPFQCAEPPPTPVPPS